MNASHELLSAKKTEQRARERERERERERKTGRDELQKASQFGLCFGFI